MAIDPDKPHAFLSYTRFDDDYLGGGITWLRDALEKAVQARTGFPFQIFQDVEDIQLGDRWSKKLDQALEQAQLFIPILTPSFFQSDFCRREAEAFVAYEARAGRHDLILPLYLIEAPVLELPAHRAADELAKDLSERQHADWRSLEVKLQHADTRRLVAEPIAALATAIAHAVTKHAEPVVVDTADPTPELAKRGPAKSDDSEAGAKLVEELEATKAKLAEVEKARVDEAAKLAWELERERSKQLEEEATKASDVEVAERDVEIERLKGDIELIKQEKSTQEVEYRQRLESLDRTLNEERQAWLEKNKEADGKLEPIEAAIEPSLVSGEKPDDGSINWKSWVGLGNRRLVLSSVTGLAVIAFGLLGGFYLFGLDSNRKPGEVFRDCDRDLCPEMVVIPAGSFMMGSPEDEVGRYDDEGPQHEVTINEPFALGKFEVTFNEYDQFAEATSRDKPDDRGWGRGRRPVIDVSWEDANAYCSWLGDGFRLPTEAEWEYAARAGTTTPFSFGKDLTERQANFNKKIGRTVEVGDYPGNGWDLHDMHGNVREWVADWKGDYPSTAVTDPEGPAEGAARVLRGGSWFSHARNARSAVRFANGPGVRDYGLGFRCAGVQE